ncbi:MAG: hypothetical protein ABW298_12640 [Candidatus Binatia bacterium]
MPADELSPIATKVIYEDEYVRVWNQVVPAGGKIEKHAHTNDSFLLNVTGHGPIEVAFHERTGGELGEHFTFRPKPGTADFIPKGHVETAHSKGKE